MAGVLEEVENDCFLSELWQTNQDLARACLEHPFVQGIADGTLHRQKFAYYVGQDALKPSPVHTALQRRLLTEEGLVSSMPNTVGVLEELHLHEGYAGGVNLRS